MAIDRLQGLESGGEFQEMGTREGKPVGHSDIPVAQLPCLRRHKRPADVNIV
jgi:hypothetical protein